MTSHRSPSGLILVLAVAAGTALGVWLAIWLVKATGATPDRGRPSSEWRGPADADSSPGPGIFQVAHAWAGSPIPFRAARESAEADAELHPKVLLVALPNAGPRHRAILFLKPADAELCRSLHGTELDTYWHGLGPIGMCAVGDPPIAGSSVAAGGLPRPAPS